MSTGEDRAWEILAGLEPGEVCRNASATYKDGIYALKILGMDFYIGPAGKTIKGATPEAERLQKKLGYFLNHSALWYLALAKDIGLTGRLVRPSDVKGGHHFFRGTHELPLERLAAKYGTDRGSAELFVKGALAPLGGRRLTIGDASVELRPLPRMPVTLVLWLGDDEFPPRMDILFDSSCELQAPLDIIWSTAMLTLLAFF